MNGGQSGLRDLYRTVDLPGTNPLRDAHKRLDTAVMRAYGFFESEGLLKQILSLNDSLAEAEKNGQSIAGPGIPDSLGEFRDELKSFDCFLSE